MVEAICSTNFFDPDQPEKKGIPICPLQTKFGIPIYPLQTMFETLSKNSSKVSDSLPSGNITSY